MAPTADPEEPLSLEPEHSPAASGTGTHRTRPDSGRTEALLAAAAFSSAGTEVTDLRESPCPSSPASPLSSTGGRRPQKSCEIEPSELSDQVRDLATKLDLANKKIRQLKEQLLKLGQKHGLPEEGLLGEKGFEEVPDFLLPYQMLAKRKLPRWQILSQDADLKRKKREYLEKAENRTVGKEVFAAFDFLVTAAAAQPPAPRTGSRLPSPSPAVRRFSALEQLNTNKVAVGSRLQSPPRQSLGVHGTPRLRVDRPSRSASPERSLQEPWRHQPWPSATVPCSDPRPDFQGYAAGCVQGNAIFSAAKVAGFTSPKESSQLQQLRNAPKGTGAFLMDSPATPHFPPTGAKTDTNFYRARPTSKDARHTTSADDRRPDRRHSYVPSTRSTRDTQTRPDVLQPSISLPRLHGRVTTSLTHKSQTWTSLKDVWLDMAGERLANTRRSSSRSSPSDGPQVVAPSRGFLPGSARFPPGAVKTLPLRSGF